MTIQTSDAAMTPDGESSCLPLDEIVARFRFQHEDAADVILRNGGSPGRLSLAAFRVPRFGGEPALLLDVERYVECHTKALSATLSALDIMSRSGFHQKIAPTSRRLQAFFQAIHRNLRSLVTPPQRIALPDLNGSFSFDTILQVEALLVSRCWQHADDLRFFEERFARVVATPVLQHLSDPRRRYRYLISILAAAMEH